MSEIACSLSDIFLIVWKSPWTSVLLWSPIYFLFPNRVDPIRKIGRGKKKQNEHKTNCEADCCWAALNNTIQEDCKVLLEYSDDLGARKNLGKEANFLSPYHRLS